MLSHAFSVHLQRQIQTIQASILTDTYVVTYQKTNCKTSRKRSQTASKNMQKDFVAAVTQRVLKRDSTIQVDTKQVIFNVSILPVHRCIHVVVHFGAPKVGQC